MTKRHAERKKSGREPKSNGQHLNIPLPPMQSSKRTVGIPNVGTAGTGTLSVEWAFAITRHRS